MLLESVQRILECPSRAITRRSSQQNACVDAVATTDHPPIYFQHQGHSRTIVGVEVTPSGEHYLLVFDPAKRIEPLHDTNGHAFVNQFRVGDSNLQRKSQYQLVVADLGEKVSEKDKHVTSTRVPAS